MKVININLYKLKRIIAYIIIVLVIISISTTIFTIKDGIDHLKKPKSLIGYSIVINNDTLLIVDYSYITGNYILHNGSVISLESLPILKNDLKR